MAKSNRKNSRKSRGSKSSRRDPIYLRVYRKLLERGVVGNRDVSLTREQLTHAISYLRRDLGMVDIQTSERGSPLRYHYAS